MKTQLKIFVNYFQLKLGKDISNENDWDAKRLMCSKIENDISGGRIISFDFCKHEYFGQIVEDIHIRQVANCLR